MNAKRILFAGILAMFAAGTVCIAADQPAKTDEKKAEIPKGVDMEPNGNPIFTDAWTSDPAPLVVGDRFRLIVNELEIVKPDKKLAKLPVASTVWIPKPNLHEGARRWIEAGGAHHSVNAPSLTTEYMEDFARMAGIEIVEIK